MMLELRRVLCDVVVWHDVGGWPRNHERVCGGTTKAHRTSPPRLRITVSGIWYVFGIGIRWLTRIRDCDVYDM